MSSQTTTPSGSSRGSSRRSTKRPTPLEQERVETIYRARWVYIALVLEYKRRAALKTLGQLIAYLRSAYEMSATRLGTVFVTSRFSRALLLDVDTILLETRDAKKWNTYSSLSDLVGGQDAFSVKSLAHDISGGGSSTEVKVNDEAATIFADFVFTAAQLAGSFKKSDHATFVDAEAICGPVVERLRANLLQSSTAKYVKLVEPTIGNPLGPPVAQHTYNRQRHLVARLARPTDLRAVFNLLHPEVAVADENDQSSAAPSEHVQDNEDDDCGGDPNLDNDPHQGQPHGPGKYHQVGDQDKSGANDTEQYGHGYHKSHVAGGVATDSEKPLDLADGEQYSHIVRILTPGRASSNYWQIVQPNGLGPCKSAVAAALYSRCSIPTIPRYPPSCRPDRISTTSRRDIRQLLPSAKHCNPSSTAQPSH